MRIFYLHHDYHIDMVIIRILALLARYVSSFRQAISIKMERPKPNVAATWLAHALNDRRLGGAFCKGELGRPAVTSLAG